MLGRLWSGCSVLRKHKVVTVISALMLVLPPAVAYASTVQTYKQSTNEVNGQWHTLSPVYANRDFDRVYHQSGTTWGLAMCPNEVCDRPYTFGTANPFVDPRGSAVDAEAWCENVNDNSGVGWTCQSTVP
jgi:hypothetical protein